MELSERENKTIQYCRAYTGESTTHRLLGRLAEEREALLAEVERLRAALTAIAAMDDAEGDSYERLCDAAHLARQALGEG